MTNRCSSVVSKRLASAGDSEASDSLLHRCSVVSTTYKMTSLFSIALLKSILVSCCYASADPVGADRQYT